MRPNLAVCPICQVEYPLDYLEIHASSCGESLEETPPIVEDVCKSPKGGIRNLNDVIQAIADGVSTDGKTFDITVSRQNLFERGLVQWQRQKKTSPTNPLKGIFLGEAGIDTGALRKEFLTTMVAGIERRFFVKGSSGCTPIIPCLTWIKTISNQVKRTAGEIMATSLAQGGPAPNFMMPWCYKFLCTGSLDFETLDEDDVEDDQYTDLLSKVKSATETTILDLTEEILNCGHTGSVCLEKKEEIIRSVVLHANLRLIPILQQIRDGMGLYSLCHIMAKYPDICRPLFVPGIEMKADADFIISVCQAEFSERGSNKQLVEVTLMNHLQDFLQELEQDETESGKEKAASLSPPGFLQWVTGQGHIPILQEDKKSFRVNVKFSHHCQSQFVVFRIMLLAVTYWRI
ncbi:uncharacterized protein LOC121628016 [Melanotaenia boesemani]|uniref:uncharacterized protein LOC121628016 n=1 Tax=Melanotaenia boesemani TaxID=1250792 RepID=UPI001C04A609|nr:uncharacterized protein LOC121628016 [Melanotaenia boesemani]